MLVRVVFCLGVLLMACEHEAPVGKLFGEGGAGGVGTACTNEAVPVLAKESTGALTLRCAEPGALICEGFDEPLDSAWSARTDASEPTMSAFIDPCRTHSGEGALMLLAPDRVEAHFQNVVELPMPLTEGEVHLRLMLYVAEAAQLPGYVVLAELRDRELSFENKLSLSMNVGDEVKVNSNPASVAAPASGPGTLPQGRWVCLELAAGLSDTDGFLRGSLDGVAYGEATGIDTLPDAGYGWFVVGGAQAADGSGVDYWLDDLVLSRQRVGCP